MVKSSFLLGTQDLVDTISDPMKVIATFQTKDFAEVLFLLTLHVGVSVFWVWYTHHPK